MIIKGKSRSGPEALGPYLTNTERNERAEVLEIRGTIAQDLVGALTEMDAYSEGTKCEKALYHAQINPEPPYRLTLEQIFESVDALEKELGLEGHARVVVLHEKNGRQHIHPVWSRIDLEKMRAVPDSNNFYTHELVSRDLERRFGHPRVQGAHAERDGVPRPDRTLSRSELRQQERTGIYAKDVKRDVTEAFRASEGAEDFKKALEDKGYILAIGDQRVYVVVDREGGIHSLAKRIEGMRVAKLRDFMAPLNREQLPDAERARDMQFDRQHGLPSQQAFERGEAELAQNAVEKSVKDEALANEADDARKKDRQDNRIEQAYARGDDYVSETQAAMKDHKRRQEELNRQARSEAGRDTDERDTEKKKEHDEQLRRQTETAKHEEAEKSPTERSESTPFDGMELTEAQRTRIDRILQAGKDRSKPRDGPDTQRTAPGEGHSRSR